MAMTTLGNKATGSIIKLKESGVLKEFYVAKHDYENGLNGNGRTLIVRKEAYDQRKWHNSNVNAYATCDLDTWFNGTYKAMLDQDIQAVMGTTKFYYTPGNGNTTVTTLQRAVFALSMTELGFTNSWHNVEGTALEASVINLLKICYLNGSAVVQWSRSPLTNGAGDACYVFTGGGASNYYCSGTHGARPAFTLPSSLSVSDDGSVSVNTPPVISSSTPSGSDLGLQNTGINFTYTVTDADNDPVTVKEYLDNVLKRSYAATLGATNTFECVTAANYQKILNGAHTLKVVANDGKADSNIYTVSFTKKVTEAVITLAHPVEADDEISVMVMSIVGSLPSDAVLEVKVSNNAKDPSPVWEDATDDVRNNVNHVFTNHIAANGFAFNFRVTVRRGVSDTGGYISNIGGAFE